MPTIPALVREADDRDTLLLGLVENVAREDLSPVEEARAYAALIDEFELSLGDVAERVGRSKPVRLQPAAPARAARGRAVDARAGRAHRGARPRRARACRTTTRAAASRAASPATGMTVRAAEKAARDGGARRRRTATTVDPALAARARDAAQRVTGLPARVSAGRLELHFGDETRLAELVEVLESL